MTKKLLFIIASILLYWVLVNYIPYGALVVYPITLLVTIFHETGHALFALITGGSVHGIQINNNGSGYAMVAGGLSLLVIPGGYIGSAIWGNLLLFVALYKEKYIIWILYLIMLVLIFSGIVWFNSLGSTILLIVFAGLFYWLSKAKKSVQVYSLLAIGATTLFYIILDFNGGPSSDLAHFTSLLPILPQLGWAIIWLAVVSYITYLNIRRSWK
ncbi:M50 family metallopeptidase [Carboxylicivirga linearis]|uniref:M50 family metallopeptidase n=1 Tax=Carboxylicivirga linearis TaxID=1628157 RepID=A0ABS5JV81_9BACT|nr:M50 family metallopeptidase [Carboxylicivirga linearis]MBS2098787.1 M50 family metallopeptidase [Carboxylicivirga linearis]